jgi:hypothetical protein
MIDNIKESFDNLNQMRTKVDLQPIARHWHNLYLENNKLLNILEGKFKIIKIQHFSLYYFLTRVYVPMFASFVGFGKDAVKDLIFIQSDPAARLIYGKFCDLVKFDSSSLLGPIQLFVLERND